MTAAGLALAADCARSAEQGEHRFLLVEERESHYGRIRVMDEIDTGTRWLLSDASAISAVEKRSGRSLFPYLCILETLPFFRPSGRTALLIGLGGGHLPMALKEHGIETDVIEIDPAVAEMAKRHFGFDPPGGVLAVNFVGFSRSGRAQPASAVERTVDSVFPFRRAYVSLADEDLIDHVYLASDSPLLLHSPEPEEGRTPGARWGLANLSRLQRKKGSGEGFVITDDFNPLVHLQAEMSEAYLELHRTRFREKR